MRINYTWPGRFHLIMHLSLIYVTIWVFGRRFHRMWVSYESALLAQRIEHEPSKLGVEGSNPSERAI